MPDLHFAKPCTFTGANGETRVFAPGRHKEVPEDIANHWFVQAHLLRDGEPEPPPATAPLQHEERVKVRATMEVAEARIRGLEAERDAATERVTALETENGALKARVADLEADVERLTAPASDASDGPEADEGFAGKAFGVKRRYQGKFAVIRQADGSLVHDGLTKAEAEAKAGALNEPS